MHVIGYFAFRDVQLATRSISSFVKNAFGLLMSSMLLSLCRSFLRNGTGFVTVGVKNVG